VGVANKIEPTLAHAASEQSISCLITLYASLPSSMKEEVAGRIANRLRSAARQDVSVHRFANGVVSVSASLTRVEMEAVSEQFMFVRAIEENGTIITESAVQADPVPSILQVDAPRCATPVVVVDSGVNASSSLMAGLVLRTISELPAGCAGPHLSHGTFVASRVAYGDEITAVLTRRASPWCPVIDVQVTGDDGIGNRITQTAVQLAEILQRTVPVLASDAKVFNLSLGISPVADGVYSSLAALIDFLSREHQVLFVISAGNINTPAEIPPNHYLSSDTRILTPAESLLALSVGAIARYCEAGCVARERELAPFSRRGPGADDVSPENVGS
jgi:hypothetical protein